MLFRSLFVSCVEGEAQGRLYLGQSAVENEHYALADPLPAAHLGATARHRGTVSPFGGRPPF